MSGATSRSGFAFQDLVLAERVLAHVLTRRAASISGATAPSLSFGIESAPVPGATPEWDILEETSSELVLEEAKSGAVTAEDRWTLWRRVRRTAMRLPDNGREIHVRLVGNADSLPANPEYWRALATQSQRVTGAWFTPTKKDERRRRVESAGDLANEALHVLSSLDADAGSPPLAPDRARRILSHFSLDDRHSPDSVEGDVRRHLAALSRGIGIQELLNALRGELSRRAESDDVSLRIFTADDLLRSFSMLERLAAVEPDALRRWHELVAMGAVAGDLEADAGTSGLAYQDWRSLQPAAASALDAGGAPSIGLIGPGGIGKTVLLRNWVAERRRAGDEAMLVVATDLAAIAPDQLAAAFDLGAFAARHRGRRLIIGVDGIENAGDEQRRGAILASLRASSAHDVTVCVTCRTLEWRSARGSAEQIGGWQACELSEWPEDRVRDHVNASRRFRVGPDLVRLLRTPLLLDLFLRTFGLDAEIPAGLQSRHGLLQAYWDRRVLPRDDERSADRRVALLAIADEEASGGDLHTLAGDAARDLTSEGLLALARGGQRTFRHALLRDFAMMQWAHEAGSLEHVVEKIERIQPSLVQFGALRAALEVEATTGAVSRTIVARLKPPILFHAGTVLGEFEDVSQVSLPDLIAAVRAHDRAEFLRGLLVSIKLDRNIGWTNVFARLPDDARWAEDTTWMTADFLLQLTETLDAICAPENTNAAIAFEVATRMRTWSLAARLSADLSGNEGFALGRMTKLLAKVDPSPETVAWMARTAGFGSWTRFWVLSELPELLGTLVARGRPVDDDVLRFTYRVAAGLRDDAGRLRDDTNAPRDAVTGYERIERALVGERDTAGLISTRPSAFVSVAVDLIAGHEADDADEREERLRDFLAKLPADLKWSPDPPPEVKALESKARVAAGEELPAEGVGGALIVDSPIDPYWEIDDDHSHLLLHLRNLAEKSLAGDDPFFDSWFWPSVARSRSVLLRACTLDLLTRTDPCPRPSVLDELLRDRRLYFVRSARRYLQRGIRTRWPGLPREDREAVLANIRHCGREPAGNVYWPGPFLSVIPEAERPATMNVFVELYRARGWELEIEESRGMTVRSGRRLPEADRPWSPIRGLSGDDQAPWQALAKWERGRVAHASADDWARLVATVEVLVARGLPAPENLVDRADLVERLQEFATVHADRDHVHQGAVHVAAESLRNLATWSIDGLRAFPVRDVVAGCMPFDDANLGLPAKAELWVNLADLADALLWEETLRDDEALNRSLFSAIDDVTKEPPPARFAWNVLARIGGWFRAHAQGKQVLWSLLVDRVRHGRALSPGLHFLGAFDRAEQQRLLRIWLTSDLSPAISPARAFARDAAQHVGWGSLVRYEPSGERPGSHDVIRELIAAPSAAGVLSDHAVHALFVGQSVFGAKEAVAHGDVPLARASEYASQMEHCWKALLPTLDETHRKDAPPFALWVFHPIVDPEKDESSPLKLTPADRLAWWRALAPLAISVVRQGPSREVSSLFRCMKGSPLVEQLDGSELIELLTALGTRTATLTRASVGPHWDDAIACAAAVIEPVCRRTIDAKTRDELYAFLSTWASPPLAHESVGAVAKRLRQ